MPERTYSTIIQKPVDARLFLVDDEGAQHHVDSAVLRKLRLMDVDQANTRIREALAKLVYDRYHADFTDKPVLNIIRIIVEEVLLYGRDVDEVVASITDDWQSKDLDAIVNHLLSIGDEAGS